MRFRMLIKAAFKPVNFVILAGVIIAAALTGLLPVLLVGLAGYLFFVIRILRSEKFISEFNLDIKLEGLQKMSWECNDLYRRLNKKFDRNMKNKVVGIMKQKDELMEYFSKYSDNPVKQTIIEQALKLVSAYLHLVYNYSVRSRELTPAGVNEITNRINYNNRKLGSLKSYEAVLELSKTIEMDEKLLQRIKEEREELERVSVRLDYIESTIGGFKHQIISSDSSDPAYEEMEDVINEASALNSALDERSKNRLRY